MTTTQPTALHWLDVLEPRLVDKTVIPYVNSPELFSMQEMANRLGGLFHLSVGNLHLGDPQKVEEVSYIPADVFSHVYRIGALPGNLYWIINRNEAERLITLLLKGKQELAPELDPDLVDAFMRYLSLEVLLHLRALGFHDDLLVESVGAALPPNKPYVRFPLSWNIQDALFVSTVLLPEGFAEAWNHHFHQEHHSKPLSDARAERVDVVVHLDVGSITLNQNEWEETEIGDFLLFDHCTLIPGKDKGRVRLTASNIPLFRAMVKEGSIKLLEYSVYQEMEPSMSKKLESDVSGSDSPEEPLDEDEDLSENEDEEEDEDSEEEDDEELEDEDSEVEEGEDIQSEDDDDNEDEEENEENPQGSSQSKNKTSIEEPLTPIEQILLTLNVEVGRIKMNLSELRKLQPGQILDLSINPSEGVELVIEGRTIGRGELLRLGESIGIRITELG